MPRSRFIYFLLPIFCFLAALPPVASADQFAYNKLPDVVKGLGIVTQVDEVKHFCAPCGNDVPRTESRKDAAIDLVWDSQKRSTPYKDGSNQYWELFINGQAVDMAYVYVPQNGKWRNLAIAVGLEPHGVPEFIP